MRRFIAGIAVGALIFAAAVGAKVVNVTNPMQADLDANAHDIFNLHDVFADNGITAGSGFFIGTADWVAVKAGSPDPSSGFGIGSRPGSLYLRRVDADHGELWLKVAACQTCWTKVAG